MPPTNPVDAVTLLAQRLQMLDVPWMLTRSIAAFLYGHNRTTVDIDVILDCEGLRVALFCAAFEPEYFLDPGMVDDSLRTGMMFNAIPVTDGPKIDFIPLKREPYQQSAFARRKVFGWHGTAIPVIAPDDLVLSKLAWAQMPGSERQLAGVRSIMSMSLFSEDEEYFQHWPGELRLRKALDASRETRYDA